MTFTAADRTKVNSTSTGTDTFTLGSAVSGFQDFSTMGNGVRTYYSIVNGTEWETGIGTHVSGWSNYFDGSGDYLTIPANTAFDLPGDFTIECWAYFNTLSGNRLLIDTYTAAVGPSYQLYWRSTGTSMAFYTLTDGVILQDPSPTRIVASRWYHVAVTRSGTSLKMFIDGVEVDSATLSRDLTHGNPLSLGVQITTPSNYLHGSLSDVRIVKGTALYTTGFTPPTTPLTAVSGTSVLTCQSNAFIDNSTNGFTITSAGNVETRNFIPYTNLSNTTLYRDIVLDSSNSGSLVNFSAGTKNVFIPQPAINTQGTTPIGDNSSIGTDLVAWNSFQKNLYQSINSGVVFKNNGTNGVVSTHSLVYTATGASAGGVLAQNGDVYFVPFNAIRAQKVSAAGVVSTYALVYTTTSAYAGGVLAPNGDIHFVPRSAVRGQKVNSSGVVSTYSLVYTTTNAYDGGVLAPNGDIHFVPYTGVRGQKVSAAGVVSTYSLVYTTSVTSYVGGVLAPNGDIHFIPHSAGVGQKVSAAGVVSTYSLVYTAGSAYSGGVLAPNGDIHFVPYNADVGQKISISGVVSTYSLVYTSSSTYDGGVLAPSGEIHFIPRNANRGQKVSLNGVVSTYSLAYTVGTAYSGGILTPGGEIQFVPSSAAVGQRIPVCPGIPFKIEACLSPFLNKY